MTYPPQYPQADNTAPIPIVPPYPQPPPGYVYAPLVPAKPPTNVAAIVSITAGVIAVMFMWLFVPGVVAIIAGLVGHRQALNEGRGLGKLALGGLLLGLFAMAAVVLRIAR